MLRTLDWTKIRDMFSLMLSNLPRAPVLPVYMIAGEKPDPEKQFAHHESVTHNAVEGYLMLYCKTEIWPSDQPEVLFFARYRLEFARDVADLFAGIEGTSLRVAISEKCISAPTMLHLFVVELWQSASGTVWQRLREHYRRAALEDYLSSLSGVPPRFGPSLN